MVEKKDSTTATQRRAAQAILFVVGALLLTAGTSSLSEAAQGGNITYNDQRVSQVVNGLLTYMEGSFGAIIMVTAGIFTICAAAFGQYRMAIGLLVVAVGSFTLRSFMSTFFNDVHITDGGQGGGGGAVSGGGGVPAGGLVAMRHGNAVDVYVPSGSGVLAYESGQITATGSKGKCGNLVTVQHQDGSSGVYCHLDAIEVVKGDQVVKGQKLGTVGNSGLSSKSRPHLHFEVRKDGRTDNTQARLGVAVDGNGRVQNPASLKGKLVDPDGNLAKPKSSAPAEAASAEAPAVNYDAGTSEAGKALADDYESF